MITGYASKLFRSDDIARYVDTERHLIPWLGNENRRVDRYDVRNLLEDEKQFVVKRKYTKETWISQLSTQEQQEEKECEVERYRDYFKQETSDTDSSESESEESKRARSDNNEFHAVAPPAIPSDNTTTSEQKHYVPPFPVPNDIQLVFYCLKCSK